MNRTFALSLLAVLIVGLLTACGSPGAPLKIRVATTASFPPFESVDSRTKQLVGFDIDVMTDIASRQNLEIEWVSLSIESLLNGVARCDYDAGVASIVMTDNLRQQLSFSDPYFAAGQVIVTKQSNAAITSREALSGKSVGAQAGTAAAAEVEATSGATLKTYPLYDLAFQDLKNGFIDAVVTDNALALIYVGDSTNNLKIVGDVLTGEQYGIAVCPQKPELLQRINAGLASLKFDGTLDNLAQKWAISRQ